MVGVEPDVEVVVPIECVKDTIKSFVPFTFKAKNVFDHTIDVYAQLQNPGDTWYNYASIKEIWLGQLAVGADGYFLYDPVTKKTLPATETEETLTLRITYKASPGGVPQPREINHEDIKYKLTWLDFDNASYTVVDTDTFETDLEGWTKVDESGTTTLDRSSKHVRNGSYAMRHSDIDNTDVAYLTKSFTIGAVSKAFIRVPVFFEVEGTEKVVLELITDAGAASKKRTVEYAITGSPYGGSLIAGQWLYLGAELPVDGTYEVRLRATCESGAGLEIFYDDIKVITKA